jgi:uncharacterized membrane protein YozB (DUF420 family)
MIIAVIAVGLALAVYFSTRGMDSDVQGVANARLGLSGAVLAGTAAIGALAGAAILWTGRRKADSNIKIAVVATIFTAVFLMFVAYGAGRGGTQPASTPGPLNNS